MEEKSSNETKASIIEAPVQANGEAAAESNGDVKEDPKKNETAVKESPPAKNDQQEEEKDPSDDPLRDDQPGCLKVKKEHILSERAPSLPPLREMPAAEDPRDAKRNRHKRNRDQNTATRYCQSIFRGIPCPYNEKCKYSHELETFLRDRPADLEGLGLCPLYETLGECNFGVGCRLGSCHTTKSGENVKKDVLLTPSPVHNVLPTDLRTQLRKKKFAFRYQRDNVNNQTPLPSPTKKPLDFSDKIYVAPLTTVGNLPFRRIMKKFGADITCGEMALCTNLLQGQTSEWALLKRHASEDVFGVQLAAGFPDALTKTCEIIQASDFKVDFVDVNMGCPLDIVNDKGAGAALMMRQKRLKSILAGMCSTLDCPVTLKMRTGWDLKRPIAHELVNKVTAQWGYDAQSISAFMIHGRSRQQRYSKLADWNYVAEEVVKGSQSETNTIPIIGNGDIFSYSDYKTKVLDHPSLSTCAMLARGALIKPWLPTEIKEKRDWDISATERFDLLKDFVRFGLEHWGSDEMGVNRCRRFLLEWMSFLHRYVSAIFGGVISTRLTSFSRSQVPVGLLEVLPQQINHRPPTHMMGRNDLETLMLSAESSDWIHLSERLLGPVPDGFRFEPKHKAKSYQAEG